MDDKRIAVLIDADNVPATKIKAIMDEVASYGVTTIKRIFGDWTSPSMKNWKGVLLEHAITPIQQYAYTKGKNATDSALIIDAMDILHRENVDSFCIVSSDSDYTRLAGRLRESGKQVIGIGERKTPQPLISACNTFVYLEILDPPASPARKPAVRKTRAAGAKTGAKAPVEEKPEVRTEPKTEERSYEKIDGRLINLFRQTVDSASDDTGWAPLGKVGHMVKSKKPDFDTRNYGFRKLLPLVKKMDTFDIDDSDSKITFIRNKE
ncbi:MAG: NYN domain-containing protein [Alistipes sp.]|nr:NYN domain-containing protein [Alistipes sp.]MCD8173970.1 NYN domain-containing protein [Alistipes sp.]